MYNNTKDFLSKVVALCAEKVAVKKANSNCAGLMYEPKRPANLLNNQTKVSRK